MTVSLSDVPSVRHALAAAWRFVDAFSGRAIDEPLDVRVEEIVPPYKRMPSLPWKAVQGADATYRFALRDGSVAPSGALAVRVGIPSGRYGAFEPLSMTLPVTLATPPLPQRSDYLISAPLWPTRLFRTSPGETAVIGTIASAGALSTLAGLRVTLWPSVHLSPPLGTPYTYTDAHGDFLFRLLGPEFRVSVTAGVVTDTQTLAIEIRTPPAYATVITPTTVFPQTINLGRINTLPIRVL